MNIEPREVWVQRVQRLADSGLSTKEFASELGVNAHTLAGWRWRLTKEAASTPSQQRPKKADFIEVTSAFVVGPSCRASNSPRVFDAFEVMLRSGRRVHVPPQFDAGSLKMLVTILEAA